MSGVRSEPAEVWLIDGRPARFVWRERLYTVLSIVERPAAESEEPVRWRCWRVTAAAGRNVPPSTFRLCQDGETDRWLLTRGNR